MSAMHTRTDEDMIGSFIRELRERGLRLTAQREILLRVIAGHLGRTTSVQEIWERTREEDPYIGIATVYRTLNLLGEMGVVNVIYLGEGEFRLELPKRRTHVTAYCRACGSSFQLDDEEGKRLELERWLAEAGLEPLPQSIALAGLCERCRQSGAEPDTRQGFGPRKGNCPGGRCRRMRRFREEG